MLYHSVFRSLQGLKHAKVYMYLGAESDVQQNYVKKFTCN